MTGSVTIIAALAVDPNSLDTVYTAPLLGGVFKSTDRGRSWNSVNNGLELIPGIFAFIRALAVPAGSPGRVYAGGSGGVFISTDGGANWMPSGMISSSVSSLVIDRSASNIIYAGTDRGLFKSTDAGITWRPEGVSISNKKIQSLVLDPTDSSTLYILDRFSGVSKSTDGGTTWADSSSGLLVARNAVFNTLAVDPFHPSDLYVGAFRIISDGTSSVFKSTDRGATWTSLSSAFFTVTMSLAFDTTTGALYAGTQSDGVVRTLNGGSEWDYFNVGLPFTVGFSIDALAIDVGSHTLYAGTPSGVYQIEQVAVATPTTTPTPTPVTPAPTRTPPTSKDGVVLEAFLKASNADPGDNFGSSLAISGDTLAVGAFFESGGASGIDGDQSDNSATKAGAVYIFVRQGTTWKQQAYIKASNPDAYDFFGGTLALSGDTLLVGAVGEGSGAKGVDGNQSDNSAPGAGAAYIFERREGEWRQTAYLKASNTRAGYGFGNSVSLSDGIAVIGSIHEASNATGINGNQGNNSSADAGAAYVFVRDGETWKQQAYLKASNAEAGDYFGRPVRISNQTIVVGAIFESSSATGVNGNGNDNSAFRSGAAYVFVRDGLTWKEQAYLKASNTDANDLFGSAPLISGDTIVVGAYGEASNATEVDGDTSDNSAPNAGAAYVFVRNNGVWSQQAYLKAPNAEALDSFGEVALAGDIAVIGAQRESSAATGVNGDQSDNSAPDAGAAYVFTRSGETWVHRGYLKAFNTDAGDMFGRSVVGGNTVVIGALHEASKARVINSDGEDNSAPEAGAAYVFRLQMPGAVTGDCDGSGGVEASDIVLLVDIVLGRSADACMNGIPAGAAVDISLIVRAINDR